MPRYPSLRILGATIVIGAFLVSPRSVTAVQPIETAVPTPSLPPSRAATKPTTGATAPVHFQAARIVLKSGRVLTGVIVEETVDSLKVELTITEGVVSTAVLRRDSVATIERGGTAPPPNLLPDKRARREYRATTASMRAEGKFVFGDKLTMRVMNNPQRIPQGRRYAANFSADLDAKLLSPGSLFGIGVDNRVEGANFGPVQEGGAVSGKVWFEARVLAVKRPNEDNPEDSGEVLFVVEHMIMPHPDGGKNCELAIPIKAVTVSEPKDERPDWRAKDQDNERLSSAVGQLLFNVPGYFYGGAASVLVSKVSDFAGTDTATHCIFKGKLTESTPCYVRIDEDAIF